MREEDRDRLRSYRAGGFAGEAWCNDRLDVLGTSPAVYCMHCVVSVQQQERAKVGKQDKDWIQQALPRSESAEPFYIRSQVKMRWRKWLRSRSSRLF